MKMNAVKNFEVFGTIELPFSFQILAESSNQAKAIAQYQLFEENLSQVLLNLKDINGNVLQLKIHDWNIDVEDVFEDE